MVSFHGKSQWSIAPLRDSKLCTVGSFSSMEIPSIVVVDNRGGEVQRFPLYHGREESNQVLKRWDWRNSAFA